MRERAVGQDRPPEVHDVQGDRCRGLLEGADERRRDHAVPSAALERRVAERQARAAFQGVVSSIAQVQALRQGVVSQTSALDLKQEGYKAGVATVLAVLDSQRDLYMAKRDYAKARYDYLLYRLRLKQAAGSLSEEDLEGVGRLAD